MIRLWPRTLSGQWIALMLLAVALSQGAALLIYRIERWHAVRNVVREECLGRAVSAYRLTVSTAPEQQHAVLQTIETPLTRYWLSRHAPDDPAVPWASEAGAQLRRPTTGISRAGAAGSLFLQEAAAHPQIEAQWHSLPPHQWLPEQTLHWANLPEWNGFGFAIPLEGGQWFNMVYAKPDHLLRTRFTPGYYLTLAVTTAIFLLAALFIARRVSRPLRHLTHSAENLGRGVETALIPEEGPLDIRSTIGAFNRMQIRLRRFVEDRTRMLAAIGHDLRTPITSLRLRTEFLQDAETRERMIATLDEMQAMTEAALAFARSEAEPEAGRVVDLHALVESLCDDLGDLGWEVRFEGEGKLPCHCRPEALRRALRNVIENAIRYGHRARVTLWREGGEARIGIEDDGPGIPEVERERVFAPFVRLEISRNSHTGGVGLGLTIARSLLRSHGGEVQLATAEGGGLRVELHLPLHGR